MTSGRTAVIDAGVRLLEPNHSALALARSPRPDRSGDLHHSRQYRRIHGPASASCRNAGSLIATSPRIVTSTFYSGNSEMNADYARLDVNTSTLPLPLP